MYLSIENIYMKKIYLVKHHKSFITKLVYFGDSET